MKLPNPTLILQAIVENKAKVVTTSGSLTPAGQAPVPTTIGKFTYKDAPFPGSRLKQ